jgi:hypothetical protein
MPFSMVVFPSFSSFSFRILLKILKTKKESMRVRARGVLRGFKWFKSLLKCVLMVDPMILAIS